ncbi:MAG: GNAT family N-acetyltransferase [Propionibacteriaceae bacterium]|jgi:RimJ/RimL family protein N-acetyltransferase|nr:GNAT family N-acetyltransferase [Propionibacteriaceae bacterium]
MRLETERLLLREMDSGDLEALRTILQDATTMAAYGGPFSDAEASQWLNRQLHRYHEDGFGLWAVVLKETAQMIGQCGLTWQDIDGDRVVEIGYLLNRSYWGRGHAAEAARACVGYAFGELGVERLWAQIRDTNLASQRVARRLGLTVAKRFVRHYRGIDMPHLAFATPAAGDSASVGVNHPAATGADGFTAPSG